MDDLTMKVGFTGTRRGMTADQSATLRERLGRKYTSWTMFSEFHHGDCVGADEQAHDMMRVLLARNWPLRVDIIVHPPEDPRWRAGCGGEEGEPVKILEPKEYLERDREIVDCTDLLIACPSQFYQGGDIAKVGGYGRSGTWYTVRYALKLRRPVLVIWADGSVSTENWKVAPGVRLGNEEEVNG